MRDPVPSKLAAMPPFPRRMRRVRPRWHLIAAVSAVGIAACLIAAVPRLPLLLWNGSASMPIGLYALDPGGVTGRGAIVVAEFPVPALELAASRGYLPHGVPAIKRVVAVTGDLVCSRGQKIFVNGRLVATAQSVDGWGRPLEAWQGCRRLGDEVLLLGAARRSFDGRYFGPIGTDHVMGLARLLWRW